MIEMMGHNPLLSLRLFILFNNLTLFWWISLKIGEQGLFCGNEQNEGLQPYTNFKTVHFVQYFDSI